MGLKWRVESIIVLSPTRLPHSNGAGPRGFLPSLS